MQSRRLGGLFTRRNVNIWRTLDFCWFGESLSEALRKLGVNKWLVMIVQSMYRNAQSRVSINGTCNDDFLIQVGWNQFLVLLFIIVLEVVSREISSEHPENLPFGDLASISEKRESLKARLEAWRETLESKGLKNKKMMTSGWE